MILPKAEIKKLIENEGMITGYKDLDEQLQPNGFDLTLDTVYNIDNHGAILINGKFLPYLQKIEKNGGDDELYLYKLDGIKSYAFDVNETVKLPLDICAITIQRSSIMRCGVTTNIGFWDSGYNGKGYSILNIMNPNGFTVEKNARIVQMIFMKNTSNTEGYNGQYQFEGIIKNG